MERNGEFLVSTPLASTILAPERPGLDDRRARLDAFKAVPLYTRLYERYKTGQLPPEAGLRNVLETHYATPRARTQIAYRVLMDSAGQAGLYDSRDGARTHWVMPTIADEDGSESSDEWAKTLAPLPDVGHGGLTQPLPELAADAEIDDDTRLKRILMEKIRQVDASDLDKVKEYIQLIADMDDQKGDSNKD